MNTDRTAEITTETRRHGDGGKPPWLCASVANIFGWWRADLLRVFLDRLVASGYMPGDQAMVFDDLAETYPHFVKVANHLEATHGVFMGRSLAALRAAEPDCAFSEKLCADAYALSGGDENRVFDRADTMVDFSLEFLRLQRELERTGRYRYTTFQEVDKHVYRRPHLAAYGPPYVWAMYFTQAFWVTHCRVWQSFLEDFAAPRATKRAKGCVLEIPSGNGLFLTHFLLRNPAWRAVALDLSDASIEFTREVLALNGALERASLEQMDFFRYAAKGGLFDRIICGEFLEHVEDPLSVLRKLRDLLADDGRIFLTVAVWAANIDHIYLYESARDVRDHIAAAGLAIEQELVQNVFPNKSPKDPKTPINYSAILRIR